MQKVHFFNNMTFEYLWLTTSVKFIFWLFNLFFQILKLFPFLLNLCGLIFISCFRCYNLFFLFENFFSIDNCLFSFSIAFFIRLPCLKFLKDKQFGIHESIKVTIFVTFVITLQVSSIRHYYHLNWQTKNNLTSASTTWLHMCVKIKIEI